MVIKKSSLKKQTEQYRKNKRYKSVLRNTLKTITTSISMKKKNIFKKCVKIIYKLAQKKILHKKNASRKISYFTKKYNSMNNI